MDRIRSILSVMIPFILVMFFIIGCSASSNGGHIPLPTPQPTPQPVPLTGSVEGVIFDKATGSPLENAEVFIDLSTEQEKKSILLCITDSDGKYLLTHVPPGLWDVVARRQNYSNLTIQVQVDSSSLRVVQDFGLDALPDPGNVRGQVLDSVTLNPVSGVVVKIEAVSAVTDLMGNYTLTGLQSGERSISARRDDYQDYSALVEVISDQTVSADILMTPKQWQLSVVDSGSVGMYSFLVFAPDGNPSISYYQNVARDVKFAHFNGTTWECEIVKETGNVGEYTSLAYNSFGQPTIVYYNSTTLKAEFAFFNGMNWIIENVTDSGSVGMFSSHAYDSRGEVGVSFLRSTAPTGLCFARRVIPEAGWPYWETPQLVDMGTNVGQWTSIKFDKNDNPAISYYDNLGAGTRNLKYAYWNGSSWQVEVVDSSSAVVGLYTSLSFSPEGIPYISYYDSTLTALKVAYKPLDSWIINIVDPGGNVGQFTSIAFSPDGLPAISYYDVVNTSLKFARFNGLVWSIEQVDGQGVSVGQYSSLAFDPDGNPAISYYDIAGRLKYAVKK